MSAHACGRAKTCRSVESRTALNALSLPGPSNHVWGARKVPFLTLRLALQMRYNDLHCSARSALFGLPYPCSGPFPALSGSCPLCGGPRGSVGHIFGACTHPSLKALYIARHNKAVCMLQAAVSAGSKGGMLCVMMDACRASDLPDGILGTRLPSWLLPRSCLPTIMCPRTDQPLSPTVVRRKLRPDLLFVEGLNASDVQRSASVRRSLRGRCTVHVVEVGYVVESTASVEDRLRQKCEQHADLCAALRRAGWQLHNDGPTVLLLGQAGAVFSAWADGLQGLGVSSTAADALMRDLHLHSLRAATAINMRRLQLEGHPP